MRLSLVCAVVFFGVAPAAATTVADFRYADACDGERQCRHDRLSAYAAGVMDALHGGRCRPPGLDVEGIGIDLEVGRRFLEAEDEASAFAIVRGFYEDRKPCEGEPQRAK